MLKHNKSISEWFLVMLVVLTFPQSSTRWWAAGAAAEEATQTMSINVTRTFVLTLHRAFERRRAIETHLARFAMPTVEFIMATNTTHIRRYGRNEWGDAYDPRVGCHERKWMHEQAAAQDGEAAALAACQPELHAAVEADAFYVLRALGVHRRALELGWHRSHPTVIAAYLGHLRIWREIVSLRSDAALADEGRNEWYYVL
jgi:hypothetical protein